MSYGRAFIVHPVLSSKRSSSANDLAEAQGLAAAIELEVVQVVHAPVSRIQAGAYIGKGQRENIGDALEALEPKADVVIFNASLSPVQQRNLERDWNVKVIDRTGLILEIFGARAQTKEGKLQVQLAALEYERSRLVRTWTHLERQRGSTGFIGGPGETQIEIDRRLIRGSIGRLKKELEKVRQTRRLGQEGRAAVPMPVVALVGYTNAGKSTLFNRLTGASVMAEDLLFATLDPTMRRMSLPNNQTIILSDTVGFISDLPTHLIEAFKATLEQIDQADVIVHVRDVSNPAHEIQRRDVIKILSDLGVDYESDERIIEVLNKVDCLEADAGEDIRRGAGFDERQCAVSSLNGEGVEVFLDSVSRVLSRNHVREVFELDPARDGKIIAWLYAHGDVLSREDTGSTVCLDVRLSRADRGKCESYFAI